MADMSGKICVVTGATNGIGKVTALELAKMGATVIVVGRSAERTESVVKEIQQASGNNAVEALLADLSVQAQVRELAAAIQRKYEHLDVLVNNAGGMFLRREETADGIEMTWALNHLNYFLLTNLLLDTLKRAPAARIVNVASDAHEGGKIQFDDLAFKQRRYGWMVAYAQSKLANIMFTYELARRLNGTNVTANTLHPGFVNTNFGANNGTLARIAKVVMRPLALSPEQGASTIIYLASSPEVEGTTGQYFVKCKPHRSSKASYDEAVQRRLWRVSEEMVGLPVTA
ncbi:MAG TPA: SDR family oxidoreductase [Oceanobacillus sp.]|nr:SDR family oxidoreductase [Oceanobacillus sp.]